MKQIRLILVTLFLGLGALAANLRAQGIAPSSQLGIGVNTTGGTIQYALSPSFQIGFEAGFSSTSANSVTVTTYSFGPYARFLFEGTVNPFIQAGFRANKYSGGGTTSDIYGGFGLEYFINRNVGVFALANIITLTLSDPSATTVAFAGERAGVEWYFNR